MENSVRNFTGRQIQSPRFFKTETAERQFFCFEKGKCNANCFAYAYLARYPVIKYNTNKKNPRGKPGEFCLIHVLNLTKGIVILPYRQGKINT